MKEGERVAARRAPADGDDLEEDLELCDDIRADEIRQTSYPSSQERRDGGGEEEMKSPRHDHEEGSGEEKGDCLVM